MDLQNRITIDRHIMVGKPIIRGTRITVELIVRLLAQGQTFDDILAAYPHLKRDDILAALHYVDSLLEEERVYPFYQNVGQQKEGYA